MVIGKERTNWYSDHPPECTCVPCETKRADRRRFLEAHGGRRISRNQLCPCGSELKYKMCHGAA